MKYEKFIDKLGELNKKKHDIEEVINDLIESFVGELYFQKGDVVSLDDKEYVMVNVSINETTGRLSAQVVPNTHNGEEYDWEEEDLVILRHESIQKLKLVKTADNRSII